MKLATVKSSVMGTWRFIYLLILRDGGGRGVGEGERGKGGERGRERIPSRLCANNTESSAGLKLMNCEILTWAQITTWPFDWLSHPDVPLDLLIRTDFSLCAHLYTFKFHLVHISALRNDQFQDAYSFSVSHFWNEDASVNNVSV